MRIRTLCVYAVLARRTVFAGVDLPARRVLYRPATHEAVDRYGYGGDGYEHNAVFQWLYPGRLRGLDATASFMSEQTSVWRGASLIAKMSL